MSFILNRQKKNRRKWRR